jgi:hypothetical protein
VKCYSAIKKKECVIFAVKMDRTAGHLVKQAATEILLESTKCSHMRSKKMLACRIVINRS